jgi:hypothetical protein
MVEKAWAEEVERRVAEPRSGAVQAIPGEQVCADFLREVRAAAGLCSLWYWWNRNREVGCLARRAANNRSTDRSRPPE